MWLKNALRNWRRRQRADEELDEEVCTYAEMLADEKIRDGADAHNAHREANMEMGGVEQLKEQTRDVRAGHFLETLWQDVRYGARTLRKNPGFTIIAILTLAIGIGANTAIFSVMNAAMLRPLPFPNSEQLVRLWDSYAQPGATQPVSYPNFADWRAWNHSFRDMAAYTGGDYVLTGRGRPVHLEGVIASASLFQVLGVQPLLGRQFLTEEDSPHADSGADAVILSYKTWMEVFNGDPKVVGESITLDRNPFLIVGVAPPGIESLMGSGQGQFWTTAAPLAEVSPKSTKPLAEERQFSILGVVARLNSGVTLSQAQADMDHVAAELEHAYPKDDTKEGVTIESLQRALAGNVRPLLLVLLTAVGVVLLIACANVAALILARGSGRHREITIRRALGASKGRIAAQLLIECALLALIGGAAGLWLGVAAKKSLVRILGVRWLADAPLDARVLGFTLLLVAASCLIFGFAPSLRSAKADLTEGLKEEGYAASRSRRLRQSQQVMVSGQVALAVVLLTSAGLLVRSLIKLESADPGCDPTHVLTFTVSLPESQYSQASWPSFFDELTARLQGIPGVLSASAGRALPLGGSEQRTSLDNVAGRPIPLNQRRGIVYVPVMPGYFQTLRIPIKAGRDFVDGDTALSEPVVIINEAAARRYFGKESPLGQAIEPVMWNGSGSKTQMRKIVGVVGDVKYYTIAQPADPTIYWPLVQIPSSSTMYVTARTAIDPMSIVTEVRAQLGAMNGDLPLFNALPLDHYLDQTLMQPRYNTLLMSSLALLALMLTAVGIYGSIAYTVVQRTREIGIRMALGASRINVLRTVVGQGFALALVGLVVGIAASLGLMRFLGSILYDVHPSDPVTLIVVGSILLLVAVAACCIPARRATRVDPMVALRHE